MRYRFAAMLAALAVAAGVHADAPGVYAITGGTVHTASGADIANGTVIIRDGLIEAVGSGIAIPADAAVIDATGQHVYPGLIDAATSLGFPSARPAVRRRGGGSPGRSEEQPLPETNAAYEAVRNVTLTDDDIDAKRATGVTTIVTAPAFGIFNGQSVLLNLNEGTAESRVITAPAALQISFNPRPAWTYPDSLMGVIAYIRQTFLDAQQQIAAHAVYEKNPAGNRRPDDSPAIDALASVLRREVPVVFVADTDLMVHRAEAIAREFNLRPIYSGVRQGYRIAGELKSSSVLVSVKWPEPPADKDERENQPLRVIRDRQLAPTTPAALAKNGVVFALVSGAGKSGDFLPGIRKAIDSGLSADDALRATTLWPAKIFGIDRQLGSLDKGKIANVFISDRPIFAKDAKVKRVIVDGREIRLPAEEKKEGAGTSAPSALDGGWDLTVRSSKGDAAIHLTLHVENGTVSGTFSGDRGSGDIRGGSFDGTTVEFTITAKSAAETGDWVFHGTLSGDSITGTVSTNLGTFPFSGRRSR